jgi:glycine hydroxymethyltransferase
VSTPEFAQYARQIVLNSQSLAASLLTRGYQLATGGTDNHLILWDLRPLRLSGNKFEYLCDEVSITLNKNSINGDTSAIVPGGVRIGTPALTSRGFKEADFEAVAQFLHRAVEVATKIQDTLLEAAKAKAKAAEAAAAAAAADDPCRADNKTPIVTFVAFKEAVHATAEVKLLRAEVEQFSKKFFMPGFDVTKLKYQS